MRWMIVDKAEGGDGGSVKRYNDRNEEMTVAED